MKLKLLIKAMVQLAAMLLPWAVRRPILGMLPGFTIRRGSRMGLCLVLAERMVLEPGAAIGHFTMVNPIGLLQLGRNATIGRGNRIVGAQRAPQFSSEPDRISALILEEEASITRDHLIDCSNTVRIGRFTIFAGWRSQILTHSPNFDKSRQVSAPVTIGEYSFIGTGCIILKGVDFPSRSILAAGSVYSRSHAQECTIYAGNPAGPAKPLAPDTAYFRRPAGRMLVEWQDGEQTFGG